MPKKEAIIAELYRLHYEELLRRACILLHDEEEARDAVGDVMARLMTTDLLPDGDRLRAYAMSSVRFECLNRLKRMKLQERMRRALPFDVPADEDAHDDEEMLYLEYQQFIKTGLTDQTRRVFQLHYGSQRLKYREIDWVSVRQPSISIFRRLSLNSKTDSANEHQREITAALGDAGASRALH